MADDESQIKSLYREWLSIEEEVKERRQVQSEILGNYAESRGIKKGDLAKTFRAKRRLEEKSEDEVEIISNLLVDLE